MPGHRRTCLLASCLCSATTCFGRSANSTRTDFVCGQARRRSKILSCLVTALFIRDPKNGWRGFRISRRSGHRPGEVGRIARDAGWSYLFSTCQPAASRIAFCASARMPACKTACLTLSLGVRDNLGSVLTAIPTEFHGVVEACPMPIARKGDRH